MSPDTSRPTAVVIGAGIGGLSAGVALGRAGWDVTVHERADAIRALGAGLSLWPNGVRALRALGAGRVVDASEAPRVGGALRRADGAVLAEFDPGVIAERFGAPLVGVHRADLHQALIEALGAERVRLGSRLAALGDDGSLSFADGSTAVADLVVGADGIDSTMRASILGDGEPADSGIVAYRGVTRFEGEIPAGEWWADGAIAGLLPLSGGRVYWYCALRSEPAGDDLHERIGLFAEPVGRIIEATPQAEVLRHTLRDRDPARTWSRGNATLLGDAAHPMLPFLGQGACSALDDAVALGEAVSASPDVPGALERYEAARIKPTAKLVRDSRRAGGVALAKSALGRRLRNAAVSHVPASIRLRQLDGIVGRRG